MKKSGSVNFPLEKNISPNKKTDNLDLKTTNINILLNRVKVEKKNNLKKKIIFTSVLITIIILSLSIVII